MIGCGGALRRHILKGGDVTVVFMTDGRAGNDSLLNLSGKERRTGRTRINRSPERRISKSIKHSWNKRRHFSER